MQSNKGQFAYRVQEAVGRSVPFHEIARGVIDDPFVRTVIRPRGWRVAIAVLFRRYELIVRVEGSDAAHRVVFGGEYTPIDLSVVDHASATLGTLGDATGKMRSPR